jgi:SAM-dependent methyltransferase
MVHGRLLGGDVDKVKKWYEDRIEKGELNLDGWHAQHSQKIRWLATIDMIRHFTGRTRSLKLVDFGCGTGSFFFQFCGRLTEYIGIEIRDDAREKALEWSRINERMTILEKVPKKYTRKVDVFVSNAAHGFWEQDPIKDMLAVKKAFEPDLYVIDLFSKLRPHEPPEGMDGYRPFDPWQFTHKAMKRLGCTRWMLDHSRMPHVFTAAMATGKTEWEEEEDESI